jgi:hypothetical protein
VVKDFLALMNPTRWAVLGSVLAGLLLVASGIGWKLYDAGRDAGLAELDRYKLAQVQTTNRSLLVQAERIALLIEINQGVQRDLNSVEAELATLAAGRAAGARLRDDERARIIAAAGSATADACRRYAAAAERDLERTEADAEQMGQRAVRAAAAAHALADTLRARSLTRDELRAQRDTLRKD